MPLFDEDARPKPAPHVIGEDLSTLSEDEIRHRIALLQGEIARLEAGLAAKQQSREAAGAFFKR